MGRRALPRSLRPGQVRADEDRDIRDEIELYLQLRTEELIGQGMTPDEARREAERHFGDATRIETELRRQARRRRTRRGTMMTVGALWQDLRFTLRTLRRGPGFAAVAVLTLGLAVGGTTAVFSVFDAALLRALPFPDHEELVFVNGYHLSNGEIAVRGASYPEFRDWEERARGVSPMAAVANRSMALTGEGTAESVPVALVTGAYFDVLGVEAVRGRTFGPAEHAAAEGAGVAVVSHGLWQRRFGGSGDVLGRALVLDDQPVAIVGVMPEGFGGIAFGTDVWLPDAAFTLFGDDLFDERGTRFLSVVGRLATDVESARAELDVIARDLQAEHPVAHENRFAQIQPFRDAYLSDTGDTLRALMGAGIVLLLIAVANVANLLLVRSHGRTRELVLRRALGAEGRRLGGLLLIESAVLATLGGVLGLVLAWAGLRALAPTIPAGVLPGYVEVGLSGTTFLFTLTMLAVVTVGIGWVPALASARKELAQGLREGGRAAAGGLSGFRAQHTFVVAQIALALALLTAAGLLTRSFRAQLAVDVGSEIERAVAVRVSLPGSRYPDREARRVFGDEVERLASEIPGVVSASVSSDLPFRGGSSGAYVYRRSAPDERIRFHLHMVSPSYFETLGVRLSAGRLLADADTEDAPRVAVITEAMAERVFPNESAVGETMYLRPGGEAPFEVVGLVEDVRYRDLTTSLFADRNSPDVFFPFAQLPTGTVEVAISVRDDPAAYITRLREVVAAVDTDLPVYDPEPLATGYRAQTATPRFAASLMGLLSALAALLACVGIYGVLAFSVAQRSREIAVRRAIGASAPRVARTVVGDGIRLTAIGLAVGAVVAVQGGRLLEAQLYAVRPIDPVTLTGVAAAMVLVALTASVVPAVRAMRRDPAEALGGE